MNIHQLPAHSMTLSLVALAVGSLLQPVYAEGYGLAHANRANIKTEAWSCKQCKSTGGYQGSVGAGVAYNDASDPAFGNTTGTDQDGAVGHVDADIRYQNDSGYRSSLSATNLGYDAGSATLTAGKIGQYQVELGYRGFAKYRSHSAMSPYRSTSDELVLPSDWQAGATTASMVKLNSAASSNALGIQRDRFLLAGRYTGESYQAKVSYQHEERTGKQSSSVNVLTNSAMIAKPIDDSTDHIDARIYANGSGWLVGLNSQISQYQNDHQALAWQSAYTPTFGAAYSGQNATDPDNQAYRVAAEAQLNGNGHQVIMHTGFSRMTQDDAFLPATINGPSPALPTDSLDGQVDVFDMSLNYFGRITRELNIKINYDYQDKASDTKVNEYPQVITDSLYRGTVTNPDYDRVRQKIGLEAKYRFNRMVNLDLGYLYDHKEYSDLDRETLFESNVFAKLNINATADWQLWLKGEASERDGSAYIPVSSTQSPNNPWLRKSYLADRKRQKVTLHTNYQALEELSLGASIYTANEDYHNTLVGLTEVESIGYHIAAQYDFTTNIHANLYLNQDWRDSDQAGSNNFSLPNWYSQTQDNATLYGAGLQYINLMDNKLNLGLDYSYSEGESDTDVTQGLTGNYGDFYSRKHDVNAYVKYQVSKKFGLRFDWIFEHYQDANGINDLAIDAIPNVLTLGDLRHDYNAHYLGLSLSYQL